ncbi:cupin domain-containing protein [Lysobacter sp. S4-A87]|uniref:cupin domain-containing protein n=1 Tax=Lysobacter sp. S4-A87 TaxID=2925843 RepID=UPI001F52C8A6|nr:cupin domain-containing protein [Lysobacter sp. S4-A87]UNK49275.1 cupin domain-containing protein [Lysobacter sp. S4-A87]
MGHLHEVTPQLPMQALSIEAVPAIEVGPGCLRRDLPAGPGLRMWVVDMAPGAQWPVLDHHETGESYYVISGEVIEGETRHGAGTYVYFAPDSRHRPHTESGVRLIGVNLGYAAFLAAGGSSESITHCYHPTQG